MTRTYGSVHVCTVRPDRTGGPAGVASQSTWSGFRQLPARAIDETQLYSELALNGGFNAKQLQLLGVKEPE